MRAPFWCEEIYPPVVALAGYGLRRSASATIGAGLLGSPGQRLAGVTGKEVVEERRGRGLGFVVGQPGSLVGFDEGVFGAGDVGHQQVDARHRDADRLGRRHRDTAQFRVHLRGDVVDGAALMQVGGAANAEPGSLGQHIVQRPTGFGDRRLGEVVERDAGLTAGGRRAPSALGRDQVPHAVVARADDLGRHAQRGGDHPAVDHH